MFTPIISKTEHIKVFNADNVDAWVNKLSDNIKAPLVKIKKSTLGGDDNVSILILVSLDKKEDWTNGILENSRYFRMHLHNDGELAYFSGPSLVKNFRKTYVANVEEAIAKINKYIVEVDIKVASMEDSSEDIATDVASRITEKNMSASEAFKVIGYADLWKNTRESDMPVGWEQLTEKDMIKVLVKVIDKAKKRSKISKDLKKIANLIATSVFDNERKQRVVRIINNKLYELTKGFYTDEYWAGPAKVWKFLKDMGLEVVITKAEYHHDDKGTPNSKIWLFEISFINEKGKEQILRGVMTAAAAGTVEDPLSRYDLTAYVN